MIHASKNTNAKYFRMSQDSDVLLRQGREQRRAGRLDDAIESFARAVESKMETIDSEIAVDLSDYLIEYADALLLKEETNSTEFLANQGPGSTRADVGDSDTEGTTQRLDSARLDDGGLVDGDGNEEESLSDLQLAWESFEHARLCLMSAEGSEDGPRRFKQLSFVHCRLGDIQALQEQLSDSVADYGLAVEFAIKGDENPRKVAGLLVSLCQTIQVFIMSSDEYKNALTTTGADNDQDLLTNLDRKIREVFQTVCTTHSLPMIEPEFAERNKLIPVLARDGFLLANSLLTKSANTASETEGDIQSTIEEINSLAQECSEVEPIAPLPVSGTSNGFQAASGTSEVIVVPVRRRQAAANDEPSEPPRKLAKSGENQENRADKATIID